MWTRKHVLIGVAGLVALELCVQLLFPYDRALPLATVGSVRAGFSSRSDLTRIFQEQFESATVELKSGDKVVTRSLSSLGASLDSDGMAASLTTYPLWQRAIPFSIVFLRPHLPSFEVLFSGSQVESRLGNLTAELSFAPVDASVVIANGTVQVGQEKAGQQVTVADIRSALYQATYHTGTTRLEIAGTPLAPARKDADVAVAKAAAQSAIKRAISVAVPGKGEFHLDSSTIAGFLAVDMTVSPAKLTVNQDAVRAYVTKINDNVKVSATPIAVTVVDGVEQQRTTGAEGRTLDLDALAGAVTAAVTAQQDTTIAAVFRPVAPTMTYDRRYTSSLAGLQAYVAYATSTQNVRIAVQQLDGPGWSASGRADESIPSASTYKLFVMLRVFDDINNGNLNWDMPMLDTTAGGCFERTIVPSANPCAEQWIRQYGREELSNYIHQKGFSNGTGFTFKDATHTTAGDLVKYLIGLNNGTLVSGNNRDILLEKMGRQLYRAGIPAGVKGSVNDKVGFLWDYIHDAGIVHNPKGTYALVIMTKGYSYSYIANVARQIDTILYP